MAASAARARFRAILAGGGMTVMPGGFSPVYARAAEQAGFGCFFLAGSQMSAYLLGVPDAGILGLRDVVDHARHVAAATGIPIFLDCDTGFGNAVNVHFTVREAIACGVAGLQIEDQVAPKKSGTGGGRRVVPVAEAVGKLRAALALRDTLDPAFVICARCDAIGPDGSGFDEAVARGQAYAEAGADLVWINAVEEPAALARAAAAIPAPVLGNFGLRRPQPGLDALAATGIRIALYPTLAASAGLAGAWQALHALRNGGPEALEAWKAGMADHPAGSPDLRALTDAPAVADLEDRYLPPDARPDYAS